MTKRIEITYTPTCPICNKQFETNRKLKIYCSTKCYTKANNLKTLERYGKIKDRGYQKKEHNTKCPTCGQTHYKRGYCMRDRIRCEYCENGVVSGYLVDTSDFEHRIYA